MSVLGVDRSPHMIERARAAGAIANRHADVRDPIQSKRIGLQETPLGPPLVREEDATRPEYAVADLRTFRSERRFDAALMMFAVIGYQLEDEDVVAALRTARTHLVDGGLLLFDGWYGPAVLHQRPSDRIKTVETRDGVIRRRATSTLDLPRRRIRIDFYIERTQAGREERSDETHEVRFFFAEDIERFLTAAGFELVRIGVMPEFDRDPDESTWNVLVCARASAMMRA